MGCDGHLIGRLSLPVDVSIILRLRVHVVSLVHLFLSQVSLISKSIDVIIQKRDLSNY